MRESKKILVVDSTLRDGSHGVKHQFKSEHISAYCKGAEKAGINLLIVGHGNGLGASTLQLGRAYLSDQQMLKVARKNLSRTKLGAFLIPGYGTIKDDLEPAIKIGINAIMIASHCTEANITRQHILYSKKRGLDTYGVLMMTHMISAKKLLSQALYMQEYGAKAVLIMDSAGAYLPKDVTKKVKTLVRGLSIEVGFHAHNNFGMAIANSIAALNAGATILDATSRGLGAGAGNCQLEVLVAVLEKLGIQTNLDLYKLIDNSEMIADVMAKPQEISSVELISGLAGVFSGFAPHALKASKEFRVDVRDILLELGKKNVVAGQEDMIIDIAHTLSKND